MEFNLQKFLIQNKLTKRSRLHEDEEAEGGLEDTDAEQEEMGDEEDSWYTGDSEEVEDTEQEPTAKDIKTQEPPSQDIFKKQAELKSLEDKKDALLLKLKSGQLSLDGYRTAIGSIPYQIKKLRADIQKSTNVTAGDEEEAED